MRTACTACGLRSRPSPKAAGKHGRRRRGRASRTLSQFLTSFVPLPGPEAAQLAADVQGPWRQEWAKSGGEAEARSLERWTNVAVMVATVVVLLALAGLGLVIWLIAT